MPDDNKNGVPDLFDLSPEEERLKKDTSIAQQQLNLDLAAAVDRIRSSASAEHRSILLTIVNALHTGASLLSYVPSDVLPEKTANTAQKVITVVRDFLNVLDSDGVVR